VGKVLGQLDDDGLQHPIASRDKEGKPGFAAVTQGLPEVALDDIGRNFDLEEK
jgi:hypothetical protein